MLSKTASEIMKVLIHQDDEFITYEKIAGLLEISQRSVHSYMKEIAGFCDKRGYQLIRQRGKGVCLHAGIHKKELEETFPRDQVSCETRKYRINYIVRTLIESGEPYTAALFSEELFVSKATIRTDIEKANKTLEPDRVLIHQIVGKGIEIRGKEFDLRKVLVCRNQKVLYEQNKQDWITPDYRIDQLSYVRLISQYRKNTVDKVIGSIQQLERQIGCQFNDYTFCMITEYVSNQINRLKAGHFLEESMISRLTLVEEIADWTDIFTGILNRQFQMNINPREGLYLYILLLGAELQNSSRIVNKKFLIEKEICIEEVAQNMIQYISSIVGRDFIEDPLLKTSVALFLNSSFVRVKFGFEIRNPFLEDIKQTYSAIFSACFTASKEYESLVGALPSEDEISYMAILFGGAIVQKKRDVNTVIIGSGGVGIAQIIARKIENKISDINIISVLPANAGVMIDESQYDLVITTVPSLKARHPHIVYTTPVVGEQDIYRIKKQCSEMKAEQKNLEQQWTIKNLMQDDLILIESEVTTKKSLLKKACDLLEGGGYVEEGFFEDVLRRESISASVLGGGVAVPHGMANLVKKPAVVIIKTDQRVEWEEGSVDVIFLLALNFEDIQSTRAFFAAFYEMTMEKNSARLIRKAKSKEEIKKVIMMNSD
ncbi:BglG family transcription antiterminator [Anaerostipes sp.]|uniref:BglG family transcription antiterminator n=1 Tax=Anaerostipes sp. TaxID=1872530 RepID=UPI0025BC7572|nr:PTS sugar transporter subunit IIA [Anaerostipes sp.]MBS7008650.1 PTS sugar transporter subunit IIA [Anaerostipes sp.]